MSEINLSYVFTTYNKLPFLKIAVETLLQNVNKADEEIIIVDAGSTDGSAEYLQQLYDKNQIEYFVSEKDMGEAHGFNKGMLVAKGKFIKIMTDDDPYDHTVINSCKKYMNDNEHIDVLFSNVGFTKTIDSHGDLLLNKTYEVWYREWMENKSKNCFICGLTLLIRRSSLSKIGLFDTSFKHIDLEYSIRITSKKVNTVFCTAWMVCANMNVQSISYNSGDVAGMEVKRVSGYYEYIYPVGPVKKLNTPDTLRSLIKSKLLSKKNEEQEMYPDYSEVIRKNISSENLQSLNAELREVMTEYNRNNTAVFLEKINS